MQIENGMKEFAARKLLQLSPLEQLPLSALTFRDRHIRCWNGRIQVTSWEVYDHRKHWNALHLFLNWKLTWTTMLYLPTTCSCSKGSFFLFLNFFWTLKKLESITHISLLPGMCFLPLPHVPFSVWAELQAWFWVFWHPSSDGKHISRLGSLPNFVSFL